MRRRFRRITIYVLLASGLWTFAAEAPGGGERPAHWAQPMNVRGVPNLHKVDEGLYRSAQPTAEGVQNLRKQGFETILNLRSLHSDRFGIGETGLAYEHIRMKAWRPTETEVVRFLQIVCNPKRQPVLVHCQHGADRTGAMCALYRIVVQGWTKGEALREMRQGGYGFHSVFAHLSTFIDSVDVESVRRRAGLPVDI
jgi:protein tyrosine phosphatase (PTP) superfamily phosphohydrolase (DUF442 family)